MVKASPLIHIKSNLLVTPKLEVTAGHGLIALDQIAFALKTCKSDL